MAFAFSKYEGLGNDFVLVDAAGGALTPTLARAMCDRHRGIGADGVLLISTQNPPRMQVINADGSHAEMCGNGIRCAALYLVTRHGFKTELTIETDAGPHRCAVDVNASVVQVEMQAPVWDPGSVPAISDEPLVDHPFEVGVHKIALSALSMGNPHAVTFDAWGEERTELAARIAGHPMFPNGVNVGFARARGDREFELVVWERGAGWTQACGTGACAAIAAAVRTGRAAASTPITVHLPGGALIIEVGGLEDRVRMTGPARHVFDGTVSVEAWVR